MKKGEIAAIIAVLLVIIVVVIVVLATGSNPSQNNGDLEEEKFNETTIKNNDSQQESVNHVIDMSSSGFSPSSLSIAQGDIVTFNAIDSTGRWPASNIHPSHRQYPGSSITKCDTVNEDSTFDACRSIKEGESYMFTFLEKGTWRYHDHFATSKKGTIIVS